MRKEIETNINTPDIAQLTSVFGIQTCPQSDEQDCHNNAITTQTIHKFSDESVS